MGASNRIIFPSGYRVIKEFELETDRGNFKCTLLKEKCMNYFRINAKQISVKYNGENYFAAKNVNDFVILSYNPKSTLNTIDTMYEKKTFNLQRYNHYFKLKPHLILSRELEQFKYELIKAVAEENS